MKSLHLFAAALLALIVASCSNKPSLDYMPAKAEGDSDWGLVDAEGNFLFTDEFSNRPSPAVNGFFYVEEGDGYTVYKAEKSPKIVGDLTGLKECGYYNDGVMPVVRKGEHITFVDDKGKTKFTLDKVGGINVTGSMNIFVNGLCSFRTADGKWGAIDNEGNVIIKPLYEFPLMFVSDKVLAKNMETGKFVILDRRGNIKKEVPGVDGDCNSSWGVFLDGLTFVREFVDGEARWYKVTDDGDVEKLPAFVRDVYIWNSDYIVYWAAGDGECGIITVDGESVVRPKYEDIQLLPNGEFIGSRNDKTFTIKPDGDAESIGSGVYSAIRSPYIMSKLFDCKFEMVSEKDDIITLRTYEGERIGKGMSAYRGGIGLEKIMSDYYDYEEVTEAFMNLFDANGLKGYPFGSPMSGYASQSGYSKEQLQGVKSLDVSVSSPGTGFDVENATIYSNNYIVHDVGGMDYYVWQYNPSARVNAFYLSLSFASNDHIDELVSRFAKALRDKYNIDITEGASGMNTISNVEYGNITIEMSKLGWTRVIEAEPEEEADAACEAAEAEECEPAQ